MAPALRSCALFLIAPLVASTADRDVEELFQRVRTKVVDNIKRTPRYTCVQNILRAQYSLRAGSKSLNCNELIAARKQAGSAGYVMWHDRLRLDVAVVDGVEMFSWAGAGKFEAENIDQLASSGTSGSGDFVGFLVSVFGQDTDKITYTGLQKGLAIFNFNVPLARSHYRYHAKSGGDKTIGYTGSFGVDPADASLSSLAIDTAEFPPDEPTCRVEDRMAYQQVKIGSGEFLLPETSTMNVLFRNGTESRNQTTYSDCREYVGESTIRFDDVETSAAAASAKKEPLPPLPSKTHLRIAIKRDIDLSAAWAGDEVEGFLLQDVKDKQHGLLAHQNDVVRGRLVRMEQFGFPAPRWVVGIRFESIERNGVVDAISLKPLDDGERYLAKGAPRLSPRRTPSDDERPAGTGLFVFSEQASVVLDRKFQSEWEVR